MLGIDLAALLPRAYPNERALQDAVAITLAREGVRYAREHILSREDRVDFAVMSTDLHPQIVAVEVKVDGSLAEVTRQLHRYAQHEEVAGIVLVTTRAHHRNVPSALNNKRVEVVHLIGGAS